LTYNEATETWTFTPADDFNGEVSYSYTVIDGQEGEASGTGSINVAAVNDAPVLSFNGADLGTNFVFNGSFEGTDDAPLDLTPGGWADVNPAEWVEEAGGRWEVMHGDRFGNMGATDGENLLDMSTMGVPRVISQDIDAPAGEYVIQLDAFDRGEIQNVGDSGVITMTWEVEGSDPIAFSFNPGSDDWDTGSFTVTVPEGMDGGTLTVASFGTNSAYANVIDNIRMLAVTEAGDNTVAIFENAEEGAYVATALGADVDSDDLEFSISGDDASMFVIDAVTGEITVAEGASFDYEAGQTTFDIDVTVSDGNLSDVETLTINIENVNETPMAVNDDFTAVEDTPLVIDPADMLVNDGDTDAGDTATLYSVDSGPGGSVVLVDGEVIFTPEPNYNGPASFTYTIEDAGGIRDTATVKISVEPVNDAPVVDNMADKAMQEDGSVTITAAEILGGASDIDLGEGESLSVSGVTLAEGTAGTLEETSS
ncbi:MAG: tandem-95 repeat protein, partial [Pseudodesulfovibrio sp.]